MAANSVQKNRYLVSFYQKGEGELKHQFRSLGVDHRDAMEVTKKYLFEKDALDLSKFDVVVESKPLTIRLGEDGVEVCRVDHNE